MSPEFKSNAVEVTNEWKTKTMNELAARGITRASLAKQLGVTRGAISQLFKTTKSSDLVPKIDAILQVDASERGYVSPYEKLATDDRNLVDSFISVLVATPPTHVIPHGTGQDHVEHTSAGRADLIEKVRRLLTKMTPDGRAYLHQILTDNANEARVSVDSATKEMLSAQRALYDAQRKLYVGRLELETLSMALASFTQVPVWRYSPESDDAVIPRFEPSVAVKLSVKKGDKKKST